ncbi:hypothetical protein [Lactococcus cremoris]|uniref:hypothetical protein n=2 Tax=Lactococcus lactis subsp. cremoris TaxID=1359 RepID=UPI00059B07A5|nr:hypothetical protein [Lactococcus cremoris]
MTDKLISLVIKVCDWVANLKERKMCNCFSTALQIGKDKNVRLITPDYFGIRTVLVDACIAPVIQHLWKHHIWTENSCCEHLGVEGRPESWGGNKPSIVLGNNVKDFDRVRELIAEVDDREFELSQWQKVIV